MVKIDLTENVGFKLFLNPDKNKIYSDIELPKPDLRRREITELYLSKTRKKVFYYMFRDVARTKKMQNIKLRFDLTLIPSYVIGKELAKTYGHYHENYNEKLTYPEVYQVIYGDALFLFQKKEKNRIKKVYLIDAKQNDVVIVPPNYGHVTINKGNKSLLLANIMYEKVKSSYDDFKARKGAIFYVLKERNKIKLLKNENYKEKINPIKRKRFNFLKLHAPIWKDLNKNPSRYLFLKKPDLIKCWL